ncbi:MAG: hypothetical protein WA913_12605 [Pricia sp.]
MQSYVKCPNCGKINQNRDYCEECNALIDTVLIRRLEQEVRDAHKRDADEKKKRNAKPSFFERTKEHPNILVRLVGKTFYSVWILVLAIGGVLALIFTYVAA